MSIQSVRFVSQVYLYTLNPNLDRFSVMMTNARTMDEKLAEIERKIINLMKKIEEKGSQIASLKNRVHAAESSQTLVVIPRVTQVRLILVLEILS